VLEPVLDHFDRPKPPLVGAIPELVGLVADKLVAGLRALTPPEQILAGVGSRVGSSQFTPNRLRLLHE
jgi:hypothetical protein